MRDEVQVAFDKGSELAARLGERMQAALAERGLTTAKASILFRIERDGPVVQRELSDQLRCTPRHVTALIDDMSAAGFVERKPHPKDRRATLVTLTARGRRAAGRMKSERTQAAADLLGDVPPDELIAFITVADRLIRGTDAGSAPLR